MAQYIKNKELFEEVVKCKQTGVISDKLAQGFIQIATRYGSKPNFANYTYREDMVAEAIVTLCEKWNQFDPERTQNPFAYFTQIIHNKFLQTLKKEKSQRNIRDALLVDSGMAASWNYQDDQRAREKSKSEDWSTSEGIQQEAKNDV